MMQKLLALSIVGLFFTVNIAAQSVGIGTSSPNATALLDLVSGTKGFRLPQVAIDSLKDITSIPSPAHGLMVFNTTQPGVRNDMARGVYYYSTFAASWIRMSDNFNDNFWQNGGLLGIQLRDKTDGVEMMDNYTGTSTNYAPKAKILKMLDSSGLNSKNNITALVLTGVNRKISAGWESRQKTSLIFETNYLTTDGLSSGSANNVAISSYTENGATTNNTQTNGLAFYVTAPPQNSAVADTPSVTLFRHNMGIGTYATDINNVTEGRLQITGFSNGDQLSLRHPSSIVLKWGMYVSSIDSSLNFYSNGSLRSNIDRVTGVYTALSDRNKKKDIIPLTPVLNSIMQLPAYRYRYKDADANSRLSIGFMAQDVQPFFPELVYQRYDREITKPVLTLDYSGFGILAVKAVQEQQQIINTQQQAINHQQLQIAALIKRIEQLENK